MPACSDFLIEEPQTSLSIEQVLSDMDNIQPYLNGLYSNLRKCRISREGLRVNHGTDELKIGEAQHNVGALCVGRRKNAYSTFSV